MVLECSLCSWKHRDGANRRDEIWEALGMGW